jgi:DNA repair exonuclease SbcCD ATPase subunit
MDPVLERFHDRNLREKLKKEFEKVKKSGELERLTAILENVEIVENDNKNFRSAMQQYRVLKKEKAVLEKKLETKGAFGKGTGRTLAAAVSTLIGGLITIILIVVELSSAGVFR